MFTFIEALGDSATQFQGRTLPVPALLEDEDGIRVLLLDNDETVPAWVWSAAHAAGAAALLAAPLGVWHWMLAETFIEGRTEHHPTASYYVPTNRWRTTSEGDPPTYRQMQQALGEEMQAALDDPAEQQLRALEGRSGFVHLHAHSEYSALDGMTKITEMVEAAVADGNPAIAVCDHGACAGHPDLQQECEKAGIKPIFGIEANFTDDRLRRPVEWEETDEKGGTKKVTDAKHVQGDYRHLILWAMDDAGLRNLWGMSTEANRDGFYYRPRMDWDTLTRFNEGVMASTACLRGPLAGPLLAGDEMGARAVLARLMDIFPDRLYIELHTNHLDEQVRLNHMLVDLAREYDLPLIAVVDSHYAHADDADTHRVWIASQTNKDLQDDGDLFAGQQEYHLMTEAEVRHALSYLDPDVVDEAVANTVKVADRCTAKIEGKTVTPTFSKPSAEHPDPVQRDVERLVDLCLSNWHKTKGKSYSQQIAEERFEREMQMLIRKGFCGYFLMVADYCLAAKEGRVRKDGRPILVGPGRGSGGGSEVAYLSGITDLDALDADLLFERFMTEGRVSLPDFDVDFPQSARDDLTDYINDKYGEEYVVRVGTHIRLGNKGVFRKLATVLKNTIDIHYPDIDAISKIIEAAEADKAGLGMSWEDLWDQHDEVLEPYRIKYPLLFAHAEKMVGRLNAYGKHAAGVVIATDAPLTGRLPMRLAGDQLVAEFDMDALERLGLVKFDFLTLRTLDTIQDAVDLVRDQHDVQIDVYHWTDEYKDPQVWDEVSDGHTLGIFQIETRAGTKLTRRFRPANLHELADVITLVRPGPMRSGLTETYFRRRAGEEPVTYADPRLESVLAKTYGCLLYQEDIMAACMVLAGYDSNEADAVRKLLGKKQVEKVAEAGKKFVRAAVERGMTQANAEDLWAQMAEFAKYSFNRAHAYGYAVLGYWTAWLKFHWQAQYLSALLSTVDKKRIPEFVNEARRMGYKVLPPDINLSGVGFSSHGVEVRYGLDRISGIGDAGVAAIMQGQPYTSFEDFMARKGAKADSGVVKLLAAVGAFDSLYPNRKMLERRLDWDTSTESSRCTFKDEDTVGPGGLPCKFDWEHEKDPPLTKVKGEFVPKPPPKRCTKACRNYTAPVLDDSGLLPYTAAEIRNREMQMLGIHLSSTPFDVIPPEDLLDCATGEEVENGVQGEYLVAATIQRIRKITTKTNKEMAFLTLYAQDSEIDISVFPEDWQRYRHDFVQNRLCLAAVRKNDRGVNLTHFVPL